MSESEAPRIRGGTLPSYTPAALRNVTPVTGEGCLGLGFDVAAGPIRLKLTRLEAVEVIGALVEVLAGSPHLDGFTNSQSPMSSGSPSAEVSPHEASKV